MNKEENKADHQPLQRLCWQATVVTDGRGNALAFCPPCPRTSKSSIITGSPFCPDYDDIKKECKWILARDAVLEMTGHGIVRPAQGMNN